MINFANLNGLTIPEGNVVKITCNGSMLWEIKGDEPVEPTNQLPISQAINSTDPYNGVGYRTGYYLTSSGTFESVGKATEWLTGCIPYTIDKSIYIKGVSFTTASSVAAAFV